MNLTNQQVDALYQIMREQKDKDFAAKVEAAKPTKQQVADCKKIAQKHWAEFSKMPDYIKSGFKRWSESCTLAKFEQWTLSHYYPAITQPRSISNEKERIIVIAMSCDTVEQLKKKLKITE